MPPANKFWLVIALMVFAPFSWAEDFSWWGTPAPNSVAVGAFAWHVQDTFGDEHDEPHYMIYPFLGVTYSSVNVLYFKNTYLRSTLGILEDRRLFYKPISQDFGFDAGYEFGALFGGYCIRSLSCEPPSLRAIPVAGLTSGIYYKDRFSFRVTVFGVVVAGTFQYNF